MEEILLRPANRVGMFKKDGAMGCDQITSTLEKLMLIFVFMMALLYGLTVVARGLAVAFCVGLYAVFTGLLKKDKTRAIQAISTLMEISAA